MPTELATGYVSIRPSMKGFAPALAKGMSGAVKTSSGIGGDAGETFGSRLLGGFRHTGGALGTAITAAAGAGLSGFGHVVTGTVGAAGRAMKIAAVGLGAGIAGAMYKGFGRLSTIQDSTSALTLALGSSTKAADLLGQTLDVVKGTPFALDQFADATSQLVTMGVPAQKVVGYLTAIGDASATKGKQANEFAARLASQFGQISAQGKITGGDILQMSQTGVNALAILANHYGVSTDAMQKMVSKGAVPADEALDALSKGIEQGSNGIAGMTPALGGLSKKLGNTTSGAVSNLGAAFSRLGASILGPIFPKLPPVLNTISGAMDVFGHAFGAVVSRFVNSQGFGEGLLRLIAWIKTNAPAAAFRLAVFAVRVGHLITRVKDSSAFQAFLDKLRSFSIGDGIKKLQSFSDKIKNLIDKVKSSPQFQAFLDRLKGFSLSSSLSKFGDLLQDRIVPALKNFKPEPLIRFLKNLSSAGKTSGKGVLIAAVAGLPAFITLVNTLTTLVSKVPPNVLVAIFGAVTAFKVAKGAADGVTSIADGITAIGTGSGSISAAKEALGGMKDRLSGLKTDALKNVKSKLETVKVQAMYAKDSLKNFATTVSGKASAAFDTVKTKATSAATAAKKLGKSMVDGARNAVKWAAAQGKAAAQLVIMKARLVAAKAAELAKAAATKIVTAAQWLFNAAMSANPIGLVIAALVALVAGVIVAYKKVGWFRDLVQAVGRFFSETLWPLLKRVAAWIADVFKAQIHAIGTAFTAVKNVVSGAVDKIVGFVTGIGKRIGGFVSGMWDGIKSGIRAARDVVSGAVDKIVGFVTGIKDKVKAGFSTVKDIITAPFKAAFKLVAGFWNSTLGKVKIHIPSWVPKMGGKSFGFPQIDVSKMHSGGIVPGGPNDEPIYRLQGGEMVLSRAQVAALYGSGRATPQAARSITNYNTFRETVDIDVFNQKLAFQAMRGSF